MEKVATGSRSYRRWIAVAAGCCIAGPLFAQDASPPEVRLAEARAETPVRLEVNTSTVPRLDGQEQFFQGSRVDVSLLPAGRSGVGLALGMNSVPPRAGLQPLGAAARPSMDVGVHWRQMVNSNQIDITAWRRMSAEPDVYTLVQQREPVYGARVEMKLDGAKGPLAIEKGFVGMQLQSGAKISIKRRNGGPMLYYRNTF